MEKRIRHSIFLLLLCFGLIIWGNTIQQPISAQDAPDNPPFFSGERAYAYAETLLEIGGPHVTGSEEIKAVGDAIIAELEANGWEVVTQEFIHVAEGIEYPVRNIVAKRGEGPITMLASHYDSRMIADQEIDSTLWDLGVPGANDGISSTSVLLEFSYIINAHYEPNGQIWLVFFDAEDNGRITGWDWIIGSRYMAENLEADFGVTPDDFNLMILFDLVGEKDIDDYAEGDPDEVNAHQQEFTIEAHSFNSAPQQVEDIWTLAAEMGYADTFIQRQRGPITDDHLPFIERGIAAVDIIDLNYPYWHTLEDTLDKISPQSLERAATVVEMYLLQEAILTQKEVQ